MHFNEFNIALYLHRLKKVATCFDDDDSINYLEEELGSVKNENKHN